MMTFVYSVCTTEHYLDRTGRIAYEPIPMTQREAERVAYRTGARVQVWVNGDLANEYRVPGPRVW